MKSITVIIVTHNSNKYVNKVVTLLPNNIDIIVVDSGSDKTEYLLDYKRRAKIIYCNNIGFSAANNIGYEYIEDSKYVLFLNPDAFIENSSLHKMIQFMDDNHDVAILTTPLRGYSFEKNTETGLYDSVGIFRKWYGRWFDKYQGVSISGVILPSQPYQITAACGALMLCRVNCLNEVLLNNREVFSERFFMYKEDIDLSLRLRKQGYKIVLHPGVVAYHGRGWSKKRGEMPLKSRIMSTRNEILIDKTTKSPYIIITLLKYIYVRYIERFLCPEE